MIKNIFLKPILFVLKAIEFILFSIIFGVLFLIIQPFIWCWTKGKNNLKKDDEARVFVANHFEIYGPLIMFLRFPFKFRPWVIDKMCESKSIEQQMSIGFYNNYKWLPKWFKVFLVKIAKRLVLFVIRLSRPIPVSRDNPRANIKTMQTSVDTLNKKTSIVIYPELSSVKEGVGEFMTGFEHIGKYFYQKTGKKISFYPVFVSRKKNTMFIEKPIIFNPDNDANQEKERIVKELHDAIENSYILNEKTKKDAKLQD